MNKSELNNRLKTFITKKQGEKGLIQKSINQRNIQINQFKTELIVLEKARIIIQKVGKETQNKLSFQIQEIVNLAINSVFDKVHYKFQIEFIEKRNRTEADIYLLKGEHRRNPLKSNGGGLVDILSFALRISLWTLSKNAKVVILDEPMKNLSKNLQYKAGIIIKKLSESLGIQFIIVTHETALMDCADKTFEIIQENGISQLVIQ